MTISRPLLAAFGVVAVLGAASFGLSQGAPSAAPKSGSAPAVAVAGEPVLLELFTSQGCSSCPPADALAEKLSANPDLVVIARPVTYWDRLGWKDTLAQESNTALQQDYARRGLAGRNGVYTPQLVVNGSYGLVGSYASQVAPSVKQYGGKSDAAIRVAPAAGGGYSVNLSGTGQGKAELLLVAVTRKVEVGIGSGENGGRRVTYSNVLRSERRLSDWAGGKASVTLAASQLKVPGADRYALVLRQPNGGTVLAARWVS
ncbi:MAG: DUF1223 domain-containing protein [Erythrobacter sp.]|uniref:DUF1223 domain-containing protein n=1 Tax=Erythrobacter sp. TaxID=1042 RepID=UPI0025EC78E6|nr:DUF1223 domain-containing protein [Erythrobacter sp.]MCM0000581.1 DUF1223 domain-containing protein [Erythrobacter sp.]